MGPPKGMKTGGFATERSCQESDVSGSMTHLGKMLVAANYAG